MRHQVNEYLVIVGSDKPFTIQCAKCEYKLCSAEEQWKDHTLRLESTLTKAGPRRSSSGKFVMREYICPNCATVFDVEVAFPGDPPLYDEIKVDTLPHATSS